MKNIKVNLIAPLVYFYPETHATNNEDNTPDLFDFGHGFQLTKIDNKQLIKPLLDKEHTGRIFSVYLKDLIMDFSSHAITRQYELSKDEAMNVSASEGCRESKRLLSLLRMSLGISKRSYLIFQDFHVKEGEQEASASYSLNLEGSHWDGNSFYPVDFDVSYSKGDLDLAKNIFTHLVNLSDDYSRVFNACYYFEMARLKGDADYRLRFSLFVTSLESIFNTNPNQISETLALRYTHLLFDDPTRRSEVYKDLKDIYKLRSHIVHGQKIPKVFYEVRVQDELLGKLEYYARELITHIVTNELVEQVNHKDAESFFTEITLGVANNGRITK